MRLPEESESLPQINIVPMIDVIFSILAFFIISTLFLSKSEGLPVNLPSASTAKVQSQSSQVTVTIDAGGSLTIDEKAVELEKLEAALREAIGSSQTSVVVVNADKSVEHGRVVDVMDRVRRIEGAKLAIRAKKP